MSAANILGGAMPAKSLSPTQKTEAAQLKAHFKAWQQTQKQAGKPWSQDAVSDQLGFGQSALSQYLGGAIPLNLEAVMKFSKLLGKKPIEISPAVVRAVQEEHERNSAFLAAALDAGGEAPTRRARIMEGERRLTTKAPAKPAKGKK